MSFQLKKSFLYMAAVSCFFTAVQALSAVSSNIIVDQFGYQANAPKLVIFAQPVSGIGSPSSFTPGATFYLINAAGGATVFTGSVSQWGGGATHTQSGDNAWQGDFSSYTTPGSYYIQVPGGSNPGAQSYTFKIDNAVYNGVVTASQRMFFYQRCGDNITAANGGANWNHTACHEGAGQDLAADLWDNNADQGAGTARDVHGGWHDAGDYGKYITFAHATLWYLMHSVEWYPAGYTDNTNIPESGNGVPDMLDEVKWELDWMLRMQRSSDGALYSMVGFNTTTGSNNQGNPANDTAPRFYLNVSTTATATGAMAFALGARIFQAYPAYASYAVTLQNAAVSAWGYLSVNPSPVTFNSTGVSSANANQSAAWDAEARVAAAAELFALTGNTTYQAYFDANYNSAAIADSGFQPVANPPNAGSDHFDPTLAEPLELGMVSYCLAPGATASVVSAIKAAIKNECEWNILPNNPGNSTTGDPYMGYMYTGHYTWGSNQIKASWGNQLLFAAKLGVYSTHTTAYTNQAEEYLHYFHGRNPLNWVYLTNMGTKGANLGASQPIMSIFHSWFWNGTTFDGNTGPSAVGPAPGILSGGPNQNFAPDPSYTGPTLNPPQGQPAMKSYKDWGTTWPQDSWEVTEPDQGYQGKYQFLLSAFAVNTAPTATPTNTPTNTATPTGTLATATNTPTATPTFTITLTPTATTAPCTLLLNGCESNTENGTWSGANDGSLGVTTAPPAPVTAITQGTHCLAAAVTFNPSSGWNDQVFNLAGFLPTNWSNITQLVMDVYVPASIIGPGWSQLFLSADSAPTTYEQPLASNNVNLVAGENLNVTFNISLTGAFTASSPITKLYFIYNSNAVTGTGNYGSFYVDNIRLIGACVPTPTPSPTATRTSTFTPTSTITFTATPSTTSSATGTATNTATSTATRTATSTTTATPTSTVANTPTNTPTSTASFTATASTTATPTSSPTFSETPSASSTPTFTATSSPTATITNTPTITGTSTPTATGTLPTATDTPTRTVTPTTTATATLTPSGTPTLTTTKTDTATATDTPTNSATASATATPTLSATSTATLTTTTTSSNTPSYTPTNTLANTATLTATSTPTRTPTSTATLTLTFTPTFTVTRTATLTATPTPTLTFTASPTATSSPTFTATPGPVLQVSTGSAAPANSTQAPGASQVPVMQVSLHNTTNGPVTVTQINLVASGTGNDQTGITSVQVYLDSNGNGVVDGGDTLLASGTYPSDNGTVNLTFTDALAAFGTQNLLVVYNFSSTAPSGTYQATMTGATVSGSFGSSGLVSGLPLSGAVMRIGSAPTPANTVTTPVLYPNPINGNGPLFITVPLTAPANVKAQIFTTAFRKVVDQTYPNQPVGVPVSVVLRDREGAPLASGLYYVVVTTPQIRSIGKLLVLR